MSLRAAITIDIVAMASACVWVVATRISVDVGLIWREKARPLMSSQYSSGISAPIGSSALRA